MLNNFKIHNFTPFQFTGSLEYNFEALNKIK